MTAPDPATVADQARQHAAYARRNGDDNAALLAQCADVIGDLLGQTSSVAQQLKDEVAAEASDPHADLYTFGVIDGLNKARELLANDYRPISNQTTTASGGTHV